MMLILKILVLLFSIKPISEANEVASGLLRQMLGRRNTTGHFAREALMSPLPSMSWAFAKVNVSN